MKLAARKALLSVAGLGLLASLVRRLIAPLPERMPLSSSRSEPAACPSGDGNPPFHGHEASDVRVKVIFAVAGGMIVLAFIIHLSLWGMYAYLAGTRPYPTSPPSPPAPRLQVDPSRDFQRYYQAQQAILHSYAWVDRSRGWVRIPIDRAMALLVRQGERP